MTMMLMSKQKKGTGAHGQKGGGIMFLITVTVLGSTGPIRFIVKEEQLVSTVIITTLKLYARVGRLPVLGSDHDQFLLYCSNQGTDDLFAPLSPWEKISETGVRNFFLCKKPKTNTPPTDRSLTQKGIFKAWINKCFSRRISSSH